MISPAAVRSAMPQLLVPMSAAAIAAAISFWTKGVVFWLVFGMGFATAVVTLGVVSGLFLPETAGTRFKNVFLKLAVVIVSVTVALTLAEGYLMLREKGGSTLAVPNLSGGPDNSARGRLAVASKYGVEIKPAAAAEIIKRDGVLTMPDEWRLRNVTIPGSIQSYHWHGYLHVHSKERFRRITPFPEKKPDTFRIMVIGDSMTYGYGVEEKFTYTSLLSDKLNETYRVEVINLGISGWQSEDILKVLRDYLPPLKPDLVVYGMVHNDFLPSLVGQYTSRGYAFPIPAWLEKFLVERTGLARLTADAYDAALRSLHLRKDFFDDILQDFDGYQIRFGKDVAAMNGLVTESGLPPIVALVFDQYPQANGRGMKITRDAERHLRAAGMNVVSAETYYQRYDGYTFRVSLWEGHGDEEAHAIWASMLLPAIAAVPALQKYRR